MPDQSWPSQSLGYFFNPMQEMHIKLRAIQTGVIIPIRLLVKCEAKMAEGGCRNKEVEDIRSSSLCVSFFLCNKRNLYYTQTIVEQFILMLTSLCTFNKDDEHD